MANLVARILAGLLLVLRRRHGGNEDSGRTRQTSTPSTYPGQSE